MKLDRKQKMKFRKIIKALNQMVVGVNSLTFCGMNKEFL